MSTETIPAETVSNTGVQRVLVPLDGAESSRQILPLLRGFFTVGEVELVLFGASALCYELESDAEELRAAGFAVKVRCAEGDTARAIIQYVNTAGIDMVAIAGQSSSGKDRPADIGERVLRKVNVPVLLMRAGE